MDNPLGIKQRFNPTRAITLTCIISLVLIVSLTIFVYFSVDKIIVEQSAYAKPISVSGQQHDVEYNQKRDELRDIQQIILIIITLSVLINGLLIVQTLLKKPIQNPKNPQQEANNDYLTNLLNRRSFHVLAQQAVATSKRYHSDLSVICFDIDHFKSINEQYGLSLGDKVIQKVAETIQENCRDSDSVFRFDGGAFLLLLPQTSLSKATKLAEKIRNEIAGVPTFSDKLIVEMTASAGVAQWQKQEIDLESALKRADKGLEQAKEQGRNRIVNCS